MAGTRSPDADRSSQATVEPVVRVANLRTRKSRIDEVALDGVAFQIAPGEVLGVAGVDGNGQTELFESIARLRSSKADLWELPTGSRDPLHADVAYIPPDRHRQGLALQLSVAENLVLDAAQLPQFRRGPFLRRKALGELAARLAKQFDVRAANLRLPARSLSGGNQQKIVIARALWRSPRLLVAVSPTRGLDVAATAYVHSQIRAASASGTAVLLISTELDEIYALADRIAVLYEGRIIDTVDSSVSRERIGLLMGGNASAPASA
jgi:simple sugar transport system ATP-binding protein